MIPFSRPFTLRRLPEKGFHTRIEAKPEERELLAKDFDLPAIDQLEATFHITGDDRRGRLKGTLNAAIRQVCVVTLEEFDTTFTEDIELGLYDAARKPANDEEDYEIVEEGRIDLGAIAAEFLALALDPYPRKPGV